MMTTNIELETRLLHLQPSELVLPKDLSKPTESLVTYHSGQELVSSPLTQSLLVLTKYKIVPV